MRALAIVLAVLAAARVAVADDTAALAYQQAEALAKQGRWAEACPLYDASYRADPEIGVLLHLADCHEHVGKLASAWAEFGDAAELAHRKGDNREALARSRADALKPKLAYLHLVAPASPPAGLVVRRDGTDVTVLVGTDMPVDPGTHDLSATAPGHVAWDKQVAIGASPGTTQIQVPALDVAPATPVTPVAHEGSLEVSSQADAHITLDGAEIGVGHATRKVAAGGHQLRVTAPGMRAFQSEIVVADGEVRTIEVPLERDAAIGLRTAPVAHHREGPGHVIGLGFAPGVKGFADHPAVVTYRLDFSFRLGMHVDLGAFVEYGSVSTSGSCGTTIPGPGTASTFDYGPHDQFLSCIYGLAGLQLVVHVLPRRRIDPWIAIAPGGRFGSITLQPYFDGMPRGGKVSQFMPALGFDSRLGVDYHPSAAMGGWAVGAFADLQTTVIALERLNHDPTSGRSGDQAHYVSFFGGVRTSLAF